MLKPNRAYGELKDSYLFRRVAERVAAWQKLHPDTRPLRLGIGDVTLPLCDAVIRKLHEAVDDQASPERFHGYMPECGAPFLREAIAAHYAARGIVLSADEVFVSSGASDELGDLSDLFAKDNTVLITDPVYPAYADANTLAGRRVLRLPTSREQGFLPYPDNAYAADLIYLCSPNNPTGAVCPRELLKEWVDFANRTGAVILFDAAYEAFVTTEGIPRSIFEIPGARTCCIEVASLSKTAGFTGTRLGYTVIPTELEREGMNFNRMWVRNRTTKTNGVSYILQKGASAVFTPEGQAQIRENLSVYRANAKILADALTDAHVRFCGGENAPYIWLECPNGMTSWEFFDLLLDRTDIVGTPGSGFGDCGEGCFRLTAFGSPDDTAEAAKRLREFFRTL